MKKVQKKHRFYWISWYRCNSIDSFSFAQNRQKLLETTKVQRNDRFYWISWYRWNSIDFSSFARNGQQLSEMKKVQRNDRFYWISWYIWNSIDFSVLVKTIRNCQKWKKFRKTIDFVVFPGIDEIRSTAGFWPVAAGIKWQMPSGFASLWVPIWEVKCQMPSGSVSFSCPSGGRSKMRDHSTARQTKLWVEYGILTSGEQTVWHNPK